MDKNKITKQDIDYISLEASVTEYKKIFPTIDFDVVSFIDKKCIF